MTYIDGEVRSQRATRFRGATAHFLEHQADPWIEHTRRVQRQISPVAAAVLGWSSPSAVTHAWRLDHGRTTVLRFTRQVADRDRTRRKALRAIFRELADRWRDETMASSSLTEIGSHWAYQRIIGMGPAVVPFILERVAAGERHWGWALSALTGENPAADTESPREAAEAWLAWGVKQGVIEHGPESLD